MQGQDTNDRAEAAMDLIEPGLVRFAIEAIRRDGREWGSLSLHAVMDGGLLVKGMSKKRGKKELIVWFDRKYSCEDLIEISNIAGIYKEIQNSYDAFRETDNLDV